MNTLFCYWFGKFSFFEKFLAKILSKRWDMIQFLVQIGEIERDINDLKLKLSNKQVWEFIYFSISNCKFIANGAVLQTQHGFLWSKQRNLRHIFFINFTNLIIFEHWIFLWHTQLITINNWVNLKFSKSNISKL